MTILSECHSLNERVETIVALQESKTETEALSARLAESRDLLDRVKEALKKVQFLNSNEIEVDVKLTGRMDPMAPLERIIQRFSEKPEASSLSSGRDWSKLRDQGLEWSKKLETEVSSAWKRFIDGLCQGQSPEGLQATLAKTGNNTRALEEFTDVYDSLVSLKSEFPDDPTDVENARVLSEQLKIISQSFDYDVPDEVKQFLAAVDQGGASLELLTEEVISWLHANQSESQYHVVGKK